MGLYDLACAAGPTLGPIVAGFAVVANGWRWAFWEMLWITGFALIVLGITMPEVCLFPILLIPSFFLSSPAWIGDLDDIDHATLTLYIDPCHSCLSLRMAADGRHSPKISFIAERIDFAD
jgi:MFS family permease